MPGLDFPTIHDSPEAETLKMRVPHPPSSPPIPRKPLLCVLLAALVAGCAALEPSPAYTDGHRDGCASGTETSDPLAAQTPVQNPARYNADPDYAAGWRDGFRECDGRNMTANPNSPLEQIEIDRNNGH